MKKLIVLSLLISSVLISCKKYEDDSGIQLATAKHRIMKEWVIVSYHENDKDQTAWFNTIMPNYSLTLSKTGDFASHATGSYSIGNYMVPIEINEKGKWEFGAHKNCFQLNYVSGASIPYEILKLSKTELWCRELNNPEKEYRYKVK